MVDKQRAIASLLQILPNGIDCASLAQQNYRIFEVSTLVPRALKHRESFGEEK